VPRWALAATGYALLIVAWALASPIGAAPDEPAHTVRAAAAAQGEWQGGAVTPYQRSAGRTQAQADLLNQQAQDFTIPTRLAPANPCFAGRVDQPAACPNAQGPVSAFATVPATTYETTALPGAYVIAGLAMQFPQQLLAPGYLGRLAIALLCALLLGAAAWAAGGRGSLWPLAGLALAATPTVLFLGSSLGPQGVSVAAALCFATSLGAFWMGPPRRALAPLVAVSGAVLALSTAGGVVYLAALVLVVMPLVQPRRLVRSTPLLALALVAVAGVAGGAWALDHRPLPPAHADPMDALGTALRAAPSLLQQAVGVFGRSDVSLPLVAYAAWALPVLILVAGALLLGRWRDRLALSLAAAATIGVAVTAVALVLAPVGWDLQGRYLLPVLGAIPILAAFVLHGARLHPRGDAFAVGVVVAGVQLLAFWESARRYAVGRHGPLSFIDAAQWSPPGGWTAWVVVAAVGVALVAASLVPLTRAEREAEEWGPLVVVDPAISISR
jgi:hypothetical protein